MTELGSGTQRQACRRPGPAAGRNRAISLRGWISAIERDRLGEFLGRRADRPSGTRSPGSSSTVNSSWMSPSSLSHSTISPRARSMIRTAQMGVAVRAPSRRRSACCLELAVPRLRNRDQGKAIDDRQSAKEARTEGDVPQLARLLVDSTRYPRPLSTAYSCPSGPTRGECGIDSSSVTTRSVSTSMMTPLGRAGHASRRQRRSGLRP